jgi:hypothetical protein
MEPDILLQYSHATTTAPYTEPYECSWNIRILFLWRILTLSQRLRLSLHTSLFPSKFRLKCYEFLFIHLIKIPTEFKHN